MPAVRGNPQEVPCVRCGQTPTVAYCHAGIENLSGRVCGSHASEMADEGRCVVGDGGHVENWGLS